MTAKVNLLCVASNIVDAGYHGFDEELREIELTLQAAHHRDLVEFIPRSFDTVRQLATHLLNHRPQILHFSGHGEDGGGGIIFSNSDQNRVLVGQNEFATFLKSYKDNIRIVFLNVCYSKACAEMISQEIDFVVGLDGPIGDEAAIDFACAFYQALTFGRPVKEAFEMAKAQVNTVRYVKPLAPVLLVRPGVDDWSPFLNQRD